MHAPPPPPPAPGPGPAPALAHQRSLRRAQGLTTARGEPTPHAHAHVLPLRAPAHRRAASTSGAPASRDLLSASPEPASGLGGRVKRAVSRGKEAVVSMRRPRGAHARAQSFGSPVPSASLSSTASSSSSPPAHYMATTALLPGDAAPTLAPDQAESAPPGADFAVPALLQAGTPLTKVSGGKQRRVVFRLDPDQGHVVWETKKLHIVPLENIVELRAGAAARLNREQFQLSESLEPRWLTVVYTLGPAWKTLDVIAPSTDILNIWHTTLRALVAARQALLAGVGGARARDAAWARRYWAGGATSPGEGAATPGESERLSFDDVARLCRRLNIAPARDDLARTFAAADAGGRGYLDFDDFTKFVRLLKARPELERLHRRLAAEHGANGQFTYPVWLAFMRTHQHSSLSEPELARLFLRYASLRTDDAAPGAAPVVAPQNPLDLALGGGGADRHETSVDAKVAPAAASGEAKTESAAARSDTSAGPAAVSGGAQAEPVTATKEPMPVAGDGKEPAAAAGEAKEQPVAAPGGATVTAVDSKPNEEVEVVEDTASSKAKAKVVSAVKAVATTPATAAAAVASATGLKKPAAARDPAHDEPTPPASSAPSAPAPDDRLARTTLSLEGFTAFLLSPDNAPVAGAPHDMTRPLSEYYVSSSHNTYLVGNQLTGESTVEGYIRALLHSCRSVELDIYDGESEPVVYHGKTLTRRVPLRDICAAIAQYAFVVSPYPIIISAEVHCSVPQQEALVRVMHDCFGDALVSVPPDGPRPGIERLPSPEDLKHRVLLKAKNLFVVDEMGEVKARDVSVGEASSTSTTTTTATEDETDEHDGLAREVRNEVREDFAKARALLRRGGRRRSSAKREPGGAGDEPAGEKKKARMSPALVALLVYTVGVKCRGLNKKVAYAPEHVFSLSENALSKMIKAPGGAADLAKHCRGHVVRVYPRGTRLSSSNYEPHRAWAAGCQLVAINWQTCDLGFALNHAMFQRNARAGYVLKPAALRAGGAPAGRRTSHFLDVEVVSAQQLPRPKDADGREVPGKGTMDPFVEVSVHVPDWMHAPPKDAAPDGRPALAGGEGGATPARVASARTGVVKNNGFNPVWAEALALPFEVLAGMRELVFVRFAVRDAGADDDDAPLAVWCASVGELASGWRHLPLCDTRLSQYLFSTLFVKIGVRDA